MSSDTRVLSFDYTPNPPEVPQLTVEGEVVDFSIQYHTSVFYTLDVRTEIFCFFEYLEPEISISSKMVSYKKFPTLYNTLQTYQINTQIFSDRAEKVMSFCTASYLVPYHEIRITPKSVPQSPHSDRCVVPHLMT